MSIIDVYVTDETDKLTYNSSKKKTPESKSVKCKAQYLPFYFILFFFYLARFCKQILKPDIPVNPGKDFFDVVALFQP